MFDLPIDYDSLAQAGSIMGSGGMIVMDENTCMVDVAKYFMNFLKDESCGKCFTCRKGTQRMYEILDDISHGEGDARPPRPARGAGRRSSRTRRCAASARPRRTRCCRTLRYFRNEYERHIVDKRCDAFVCKELVGAPCQSACPLGTEAWRYVAHIARGEYERGLPGHPRGQPVPVGLRPRLQPSRARSAAGPGPPAASRWRSAR